MIGHRYDLVPRAAQQAVEPVFPRALAGIDFTPASLAAARWGITHVAAGAEAIVAHIIPSPAQETEDGSVDSLPAHGQAPALHGGLDGFAATLPVAGTRTIVRAGRPSQWLCMLSNELDAALVILGRRSDANRRGIGEPSVVERTARRVEGSVLVVPDGTLAAPRSIVVGIDRSGTADAVLSRAEALAELHDCPLTVIHVVEPTIATYDRVIRASRGRGAVTPVTGDGHQRAREMAPWIPELLERASLSRDHGLEVTTGDPARDIATWASQCESPLIVVGKRGADGAPAGSIGSVARELLLRAPFPVLAVGHGA